MKNPLTVKLWLSTMVYLSYSMYFHWKTSFINLSPPGQYFLAFFLFLQFWVTGSFFFVQLALFWSSTLIFNFQLVTLTCSNATRNSRFYFDKMQLVTRKKVTWNCRGSNSQLAYEKAFFVKSITIHFFEFKFLIIRIKE